MFEKFTERARMVLVFAQDEARALRHDYLGTEHLLLGLLREDEGVAARVLDVGGVTLAEVRAEVARTIGVGEEPTPGQIPFTPRAKKVLELSLKEAQRLGHKYMGTEHLLLGLARENEGVASRILLGYDLTADLIRTEVEEALVSGHVGMPGLTATEHEPEEADPALAAEVERIRNEKEDAIAAGEFERAARLRDEERRLRRRLVPRAHIAVTGGTYDLGYDVAHRQPSRVSLRDSRSLAVGGGIALVAAALGLLAGRLIWG